MGPDWTRVSTFLRRSEQEMQEHKWEREREREREKADRVRSERRKRGRIRETLERRESLARERRDRVPGGQDRFELSKIYGRRFDLRARGVTPGSLGQGP